MQNIQHLQKKKFLWWSFLEDISGIFKVFVNCLIFSTTINHVEFPQWIMRFEYGKIIHFFSFLGQIVSYYMMLIIFQVVRDKRDWESWNKVLYFLFSIIESEKNKITHIQGILIKILGIILSSLKFKKRNKFPN